MRKLLYHPLVVLLVTAMSFAYLLSLRTTLQKADQPSETVGVLEQEIDYLASEVSRLEQQAEASQTEFSREKIIRDELLMQKPGEYIIQLPDTIPVVVTQPSPPPTPTPWEAWRKLLLQ